MYNMRSFFPKQNNFCLDFVERDADVAFLTEVWEKKENKKHKKKLEEMLELKGINYVSTPRPGKKRGGGAALAFSPKNFVISKLNISIPKSVEAVWAILKPRLSTAKISKIILCCFYLPPNAGKNSLLLDHLTKNLQDLLAEHKNAGVIIMGDRNEMEIAALLSIDPSLTQLVTKPTRENNILDVIITNLESLYTEPTILPAIEPDDPTNGVPSDHYGVFAKPRPSCSTSNVRKKIRKLVRPLPESLINIFGQKLSTLDFKFIPSMNSDEMVANFENELVTLVNEVFPQKSTTYHILTKI